METTQSAGMLLGERYRQLLAQKEQARLQQSTQPSANQLQVSSDEVSSIENTVVKLTNNTSIETSAVKLTEQGIVTAQDLPTEIKQLITGNDYWVLAKSNRYKKLIREGHLEKLLELAKMAQNKDNPANWFAKACSKAAWERTLAYFTKLTEVAHTAEQVARRVGTKVNKFIYKQIWKGVNVERWAVQAEEMKHDKRGQSREKHFAWLCVNERLVLAGAARS